MVGSVLQSGGITEECVGGGGLKLLCLYIYYTIYGIFTKSLWQFFHFKILILNTKDTIIQHKSSNNYGSSCSYNL